MYVRVKGSDGGSFRIESGVRLGCIRSPWLLSAYGWNKERSEKGVGENGVEISRIREILYIKWLVGSGWSGIMW